MGTKQFDNYADLITFTRASSATYLDSDGVLKTASTNTPRIEYDADGNRLGLLIEEQRTNLVTYSEEFDNAAWTKYRSTVDANSIVAPDGTLTGDKLVQGDGETTTGGVSDGVTTTATSYTYSVYAKAGEYSGVILRKITGSLTGVVAFNLLNGTVSKETLTNIGTSIVPVGNGWYRCSVTFNGSAETANYGIQVSNESGDESGLPAGDGTSGIYIWGAQLEAGAFPTSYIPTSGSTATRAADVASIPTSAFGYNASEGTVVVDFEAAETGTNNTALAFSNTVSGSFTDQILIWNAANSNGYVLANGVTQAQFGNPTDQNGQVKISFAFKKNDFAISYDGNSVVTDTSGIMPSNIEVMKIGDWTNSGQRRILNGTIKSIKYYPRRLTNAQLQELTQ